jgi:hypothetical protein
VNARHGCSILLLLGALASAGASAAAEPSADAAKQVEPPRSLADSSATPAQVTQRLARLQASIGELEQRESGLVARLSELEAQAAGEVGDAPEVDPDASAARERELTRARDEAADALASVRGELEAARAAKRPVAILASYFAKLEPRARLALDEMGMPSESIRREARDVDSLAQASERMADRLGEVQGAIAAGRLGGFVSEREASVLVLAEIASSLHELASDLADTARELESTFERQRQRSVLARSEISDALLAQSQERIDALYVQHLDTLRTMRLRAQASGGDAARAARIAKALDALGDESGAVRSIQRAQSLGANAQRLLLEARAVRDALPELQLRLEMELERQLVSALEPLAREETRRAANRLSRELLTDLRSETLEAWSRIAMWADQVRADAPAAPGRWREWWMTAIAIGGLCGGAVLLGTRRVAPMPALIRRTARLPIARGRVGTVVRWGNLIQVVFPSLACIGLLYGALAVMGFERPAVWVASVVLFWCGLYIVGARVLSGLTRPVSRSRPALLAVSEASSDRLARTYRGLGAVVSLVIVDEVAAGFLGVGRLRTLIEVLFWTWLVGWAVWAAVVWRSVLAASWAKVGSQGEAQLAGWMTGSRLGFVLSPLAAARIAGARLAAAIRAALAARGFFEYVRAKLLRRMARDVDSELSREELPERYTREFPLYPLLGEGDAVVLPRTGPVDDVLSQIDAWRKERVDGSLVLLGEKGLGKTTLVGQVARRISELPALEHSVVRKIIEEEKLARSLGPLFDAQDARTIDDVIAAAERRGECVVLLDEAHNLFLRTIGGYRAFDALVRLVNATSEHVFWLVVFNSFAWEFINESRGRMHYFRRLMSLPTWSADELQDLIGRRNSKAGFDVAFDPTLLDERDGGSGDFRLIENADGFFRMLWETSGGNPRVALYYWLQSLVPTGDDSLRVQLFAEPSLDRIEGLKDEMIFVLAAICQHENLSAPDLGTVLRMPERKAEFAIQFLRERRALFALSGSLAVMLGFALKDFVASVLASLTILLTRPFQVGDRIKFASYYGEVVEVGLRSVRLVTPDDNLVTIPSSTVLTEAVASANAGSLDCMVVVRICVPMSADVTRAREIVEEAVLASRYLCLGKPFSVLVGTRQLGASLVVELTARAFVYDARHELAFASDITDLALRQLREEDMLVSVARVPAPGQAEDDEAED